MPDIRLSHGCITAEQLLLNLPQRRTSLDQINRLDARPKSLEIPKRLPQTLSACAITNLSVRNNTHSQQVVHQRPLPRSHLHELYTTAFPALRDPFCNRPHSHQFAKHLRDLRGRDKVSFLPEHFPSIRSSRIVAIIRRREDLAHKRRDWDGAGHLDPNPPLC